MTKTMAAGEGWFFLGIYKVNAKCILVRMYWPDLKYMYIKLIPTQNIIGGYYSILQLSKTLVNKNNLLHISFPKYHNLRVSIKVSKGAKIRNWYNQVPHLTQDTNGKVTNSQLGTTNESQTVSPFPVGDHKAHINRRTQRNSKHKAEKNIKDPQKKCRLGTVSKIFYWRA